MKSSYMVSLVLSLVMTGCGVSTNDHAEADAAHTHGEGSVPYTVFTDSCEYFAEITPMVRGKRSNAGVHITRLSHYKPLGEGTISIRLLRAGKVIASGDTNKPRIPGIFPVSFTPTEAGPVSIQILFSGEGLRDSVVIDGAMVFESEEEADRNPPVEEPSAVIKFTKEMAWKSEFSVTRIIPRDFDNMLKVSGEILIPPSDISTIPAKGNGILLYRSSDLIPGRAVEQGQLLATLTGEGLTSQNMDSEFTTLKARYEASRNGYERDLSLLQDQIISGKQFAESRSRYRSDSARYFSFLQGMSGGGMSITSPMKGFVLELIQPNGSYVTEGAPLLSIARNNRLLLRADVPQRFRPEIASVRSASFRPSGSDRVYDLAAHGGVLIARGNTVKAGDPLIPVTFAFTNDGSITAGSFAEIFLHTTTRPDQLVIPAGALFEEQGSYYVYVQFAGESFLKRFVKPGFSDGLNVNILSGLMPGDRVVTRGGIFIKASSQMSGTPAHGHEH